MPSLRQRKLAKEWAAIKMDDKVFQIMRSTIHRGAPESLLATLFPLADGGELDDVDTDEDDEDLNAFGIPLFRDESHPLRPVLFDRNPKYFEPLVNYLRCGELVIDEGISRRGVLHEAQYFTVDGVVQQLSHVEPDDHGVPKPLPTTTTYTRRDIEQIVLSGQLDKLTGINFSGADFSGLDLSKARFDRCNLEGVDFSRCVLYDAFLTNCQMCDAKFESTKMDRIQISNCVAERAIFDRASLVGSRCGDNNFVDATFCEAQCSSSSFHKSLMCHVDATRCMFQNADLTQCNMSEANLTGADFTQASMRRAILHGVEREGTNLSMGGVLS